MLSCQSRVSKKIIYWWCRKDKKKIYYFHRSMSDPIVWVMGPRHAANSGDIWRRFLFPLGENCQSWKYDTLRGYVFANWPDIPSTIAHSENRNMFKSSLSAPGPILSSKLPSTAGIKTWQWRDWHRISSKYPCQNLNRKKDVLTHQFFDSVFVHRTSKTGNHRFGVIIKC